ncbi:MAG: hypothetical protein KTR23_11210 [Rhodospirillales bacterium]|nr:hypothetical protein [Rhodospirillales bacterium]
MNLIYNWQSLIGAFVSFSLAIGLFQYQRHLDRNKQRNSHIFTTIRALKRIRSHFENVKIAFAKSTIERVLVNARTLALVGSPSSNKDQEFSCNSIEAVIMLTGKYADILSTIPRDQDVSGDIITKIDEIEDAVEQTTYALESLLNRMRAPSEWTYHNENLETIALVEAIKLLEDVSTLKTLINHTLEELQHQYSKPH